MRPPPCWASRRPRRANRVGHVRATPEVPAGSARAGRPAAWVPTAAHARRVPRVAAASIRMGRAAGVRGGGQGPRGRGGGPRLNSRNQEMLGASQEIGPLRTQVPTARVPQDVTSRLACRRCARDRAYGHRPRCPDPVRSGTGATPRPRRGDSRSRCGVAAVYFLTAHVGTFWATDGRAGTPIFPASARRWPPSSCSVASTGPPSSSRACWPTGSPRTDRAPWLMPPSPRPTPSRRGVGAGCSPAGAASTRALAPTGRALAGRRRRCGQFGCRRHARGVGHVGGRRDCHDGVCRHLGALVDGQHRRRAGGHAAAAGLGRRASAFHARRATGCICWAASSRRRS